MDELQVDDPIAWVVRSGLFTPVLTPAVAAEPTRGTDRTSEPPSSEARTSEARTSEPAADLSEPGLYSYRIELPRLSGYTWARHAHSVHELLWAVDGVLTVRTDRTAFALPSGLSIWIPAFEPHEVNAGPGTTLCCSYLAGRAPRPDLESTVAFATDPLLDAVLEHLMDPALSPARRRRAEAFAMDLIDPTPHTRLDIPLPRTPWLRAVAEELLDNPADTRSVVQWAEGGNVSVRTLMRRFAQETGLSLSSWRLQARIALARQRLAAGQSVAAVAISVGFRSPTAFGTAFRRSTGVSPREFTRSIADGQPPR